MTGTDDNILSGNIWLFIAFVIINYTNKYTPKYTDNKENSKVQSGSHSKLLIIFTWNIDKLNIVLKTVYEG